MSIVPVSAAGRNDPPRYNIAPTQTVGFVCEHESERVVKDGTWWLIPFWAKERPKYPTFNARSETAQEKSSFRDSFKTKRCLIPASGYYEWTKGDDGGKDPHAIALSNGKPFAFAGLWAFNSKLGVTSCTILTAPAHPNIAQIHDRMPIILKDDVHKAWLDKDTAPDKAHGLLSEHRASELTSWRVSRDVNSSRAQGADLWKPVAE